CTTEDWDKGMDYW
nr:immunoglobulin heavy chain junction region [Mus musculus]